MEQRTGTGTAFSRICTYATETKGVTDGDGRRFVEGYASSGSVDRQGEVVNQRALYRAFDAAFARTRKGLPYLRDHWPWAIIGKVVEFRLDGDRLWTKAELLPEGKSAEADALWNVLEADIPVSQSIGFNPLRGKDGIAGYKLSGDADDSDVWHWGGVEGDKDFDLLELSAVTLGANMDADLQMAKSLGIATDRPWQAQADKRIVAGVALEDLTDAEELRFYDDCDRALKALTGMDNITRHWRKEGRALSAEVLDALLSPISSLAELAKAGQVLSARNREAVISARDALIDVLSRDDASRTSRESTDDKSAEAEETDRGHFDSLWYGV